MRAFNFCPSRSLFMQRVNLDSAPAAVKNFVSALPNDPDGVELVLNGQVVRKVIGPQQLTEPERAELLDKVTKQIRRAHQRNKAVPARVIAREVQAAVEEVRSRGKR